MPGKDGEIQLTDALKTLKSQEAMYAYNFEGKRYDVGDKLGFLQATVEFALRKDELKKPFMEYLINLVENLRIKNQLSQNKKTRLTPHLTQQIQQNFKLFYWIFYHTF
jgi:hypothetical protein